MSTHLPSLSRHTSYGSRKERHHIAHSLGSAYNYRPVDAKTIRLLRIHQANDKVICSLAEYPLDDPLGFYALSYVWGTEAPSRIVECDGRTIAVTPNLFAGLQDLHHNFKSQLFWIDAICINQKDDAEKAVQVPLMTKIFSTAELVVIWLGPSTFDSALGVSTLRYFQKTFEAGIPVELNGRGVIDDEFLKAHRLPALGDPAWPALARLLYREWFSRLWVVQEAVLASDLVVLCGNVQISWKDIESVIGTLNQMPWRSMFDVITERNQIRVPPDYAVNAVMFIQQVRSMTIEHRNNNPIFILDSTRAKISAEPIDKVYGVLGLMSPEIRRRVEVDYSPTSRKNYFELYKQFCKILIQENGLDVLKLAPSESRQPNLPSWCPDFLEALFVFAGNLYHASSLPKSASPPDPVVINDSYNLTFTGCVMDCVRYVSDLDADAILDLRFNPSASSRVMSSEAGCLELSKSTYGCTDPPIEHVRSLIKGAKWSQRENGALYTAGDLFEGYHDAMTWLHFLADKNNDISTTHSGITPTQIASAMSYLHNMAFAWKGSSFFSTEGGRTGIAPESVQPGDSIVTVFTADQPYILHFNKERNHYEFVGEAYVEGLMDGEEFRARDPLNNYETFLVR